MVKSEVSPNAPMSCSTLSCPASHPNNRLVAGRAFSHLMGVQALDYHQIKQEAAAEQEDTHLVSRLVLEAGSTHRVLHRLSARASCCTSLLQSHLLQSHGAGQALSPKLDCLKHQQCGDWL